MRAEGLPGASVAILIDGEKAAEHSVENDALKATAFIEAIPGANFVVVLNIEPNFAYRLPMESLQYKVLLDGQQARCKIVSVRRTHHPRFVVDGELATENGANTLRPFQFAEHETTEDAPRNGVLEKLENLGEIKVELKRCHEAGTLREFSGPSRFKAVGENAVPEKATKGRSISSHTKLGPAEPVNSGTWIDVTYPYGEEPIATYIFQYRTRRDLEIEGIIERAPSPVPLVDRDPDDLTPDELREQNRLLRERRPAVEIKKEFKREKRSRQRSTTLSNEDDDEGDVTFVSETNKRRRTRESMENSEVIDLGDD